MVDYFFDPIGSPLHLSFMVHVNPQHALEVCSDTHPMLPKMVSIRKGMFGGNMHQFQGY